MALPKAARKAIKAEVARLKQVEVMARQKRRAAELLLADDDDLVAPLDSAHQQFDSANEPFANALAHGFEGAQLDAKNAACFFNEVHDLVI